MTRPRSSSLCWLVACLALAACARDEASGAASIARRRTLVVFAASSLTESFRALEARFEASHVDVDLVLSLAGSQALRTQLEHGARADVFASADRPHLDALTRQGLAEPGRAFTWNELVIAVPREGVSLVGSAAELVRAPRVVLGARVVPIGEYTERYLERAGTLYGEDYREAVLARVVSREANVRLVLAKIALGEADAAIVYRTDTLASASRVRVVELPEEASVRAAYFAARLRASRAPELAEDFLALLVSEEGKAIFAALGFVGGDAPRAALAGSQGEP